MVVNFVDILAHKSSQTDVLKEMIQDESGFRSAVKIWFEHSWLLKVLKKMSEENFSVILTSDHGSIRVNNSVLVSADKSASSGVRYKYGRNLNTNKKNTLIIKNPSDFRLPAYGPQPSYLIAKDDVYFIYPSIEYEQKHVLNQRMSFMVGNRQVLRLTSCGSGSGNLSKV